MKRIVIADDSATTRMLTRRRLEIIGLGDAEIIEVEHGEEALTAVTTEPTGLLLTDLNMPVMDGETLLRLVKASPELMNMPVVIITSSGNQAKKQELMALGALNVINKPVTTPQLMEALAAFIDD